MLYLLDANVLITASNHYYPIDQVPEFWSWLHHQAASGNVAIPIEIMEEILGGRREGDLLLDWISEHEIYRALLLEESVSTPLVQSVVMQGYAADLTDDEVEQIGRDPFLVAYAIANSRDRCVVTTEVSKPSKQRQNRKLPDVCTSLGVHWCGPFDLNRRLGFRTNWRGAI